MNIRVANANDASKLLEIYAYYVTNTAITFECHIPTLEEFTTRIENTLKDFPYLVAEENGEILGYAYASHLKSREAYRFSIETSIYVNHTKQKGGIGKALYHTLETYLCMQNIQNIYACIAYAPVEDEYLTNNSTHFHEHLGYRLIGTFKQCAYKFHRWYDMVWMEKFIGNHNAIPQEFIPFSKLHHSSNPKM